MKPIYFRGLALEKGTYSIPLEPSQHCGASWMGLTHSSPEHPDTSETSSSDRNAKILGEMKWKITMTEASNITFEATPAPCLGLKPVYCESSSMRAVTIEVRLKPIRHCVYACGHVLLPNGYRRSPDPFTTLEDRFSWIFTTRGSEKRIWPASRAFCTHASALEIEIDVPGAGKYEFCVENVRPHTSAAEYSMTDRIPESPFNKSDSRACKAPAGSRESNSGERAFPSNGPNSAGGEIVPVDSPVPGPGEFSGDPAQSYVEPRRSGKRSNGGSVECGENVRNKRRRE